MKKILFVMMCVLCLIPWFSSSAAQVSSNPMLLEWSSEKIWVSQGNLYVSGTFTNKTKDLTVTKLNSLTMTVYLTRPDGTQFGVTRKPTALPLARIPSRRSKEVILNLGPVVDGLTWNHWRTEETYSFTLVRATK